MPFGTGCKKNAPLRLVDGVSGSVLRPANFPNSGKIFSLHEGFGKGNPYALAPTQMLDLGPPGSPTATLYEVKGGVKQVPSPNRCRAHSTSRNLQATRFRKSSGMGKNSYSMMDPLVGKPSNVSIEWRADNEEYRLESINFLFCWVILGQGVLISV